MAAVGPL
ncbi:hypothetical protein YPPY42_1362, partial [Yersinia pestis PY-42]